VRELGRADASAACDGTDSYAAAMADFAARAQPELDSVRSEFAQAHSAGAALVAWFGEDSANGLAPHELLATLVRFARSLARARDDNAWAKRTQQQQQQQLQQNASASSASATPVALGRRALLRGASTAAATPQTPAPAPQAEQSLRLALRKRRAHVDRSTDENDDDGANAAAGSNGSPLSSRMSPLLSTLSPARP
jgi:hypothetical protein